MSASPERRRRRGAERDRGAARSAEAEHRSHPRLAHRARCGNRNPSGRRGRERVEHGAPDDARGRQGAACECRCRHRRRPSTRAGGRTRLPGLPAPTHERPADPRRSRRAAERDPQVAGSLRVAQASVPDLARREAPPHPPDRGAAADAPAARPRDDPHHLERPLHAIHDGDRRARGGDLPRRVRARRRRRRSAPPPMGSASPSESSRQPGPCGSTTSRSPPRRRPRSRRQHEGRC